jgi:hypothetical protein
MPPPRLSTGSMVSSLGVRDQGLGAGGSFEKYLLLISCKTYFSSIILKVKYTERKNKPMKLF